MKNYPFILFVILNLNITSNSQSLTIERASAFIESMKTDSDSLGAFVLQEELEISKRLSITYDGVKTKFLISYEIPQQVIKEIKEESLKYTLSIEKIDGEFSILNFKTDNFKTKYYFKNGFLISPPYFFSKGWKKIESEHFIFYVSEPELFNQYSVNQLEDFVKNIFSVLKFTDEEKKTIQKEKLIYILCKDENEIEKLTGYKARGMGNLAYDYVITTYNCHYHEVLHILLNFKLKSLPLYTHPFFQEGFAVAFGGRGGYEPGIILNLGKFLEQSEFLNKNQLLNADEYKSYDVSMSYPLSGLYNLFLIQELGIDSYLKLYLKYSSGNVTGSVINPADLPEETKWNNFVSSFTNDGEIGINFGNPSHQGKNEDFKTLIENSTLTLKENEEFYLLETIGNILITANDKQENYHSKLFNEFYPDKNYNGEKYLIKVNDSEAAIYNIYTNNLIANYVSGFSIDMKPVPKENGYYKFLMNQIIFDEKETEWILKIQD